MLFLEFPKMEKQIIELFKLLSLGMLNISSIFHIVSNYSRTDMLCDCDANTVTKADWHLFEHQQFTRLKTVVKYLLLLSWDLFKV